MNFTDIPILFQNNDFVAVDKPAGLSVHNQEDPQNLLGVLQKQLNQQKLYPVHRLDKETSGVQLIALNDSQAKKMAIEFEKKTVKKFYVGVLRGTLKEKSGAWKQALTDKAEGRKSPAGSPANRVQCETRFEIVNTNKYFTYCAFDLITGRQHQIRKHAALANHALVGDPRYGDMKYNQKMAQIYKTERLFLHCSKVDILGMSIEAAVPAIFSVISAEQ